MDTKPLERFATQARRDLLAAVDAQATAVLATGSVARAERAEVVRKLEAEIAAHGRTHVVDKVAYIWFNRIIALRFMDARGYTDAGVVSPAQGQAHGQPEVLADAKRGNLDADVVINKNTAEAIIGLLDGTRRSTDAEGEAYALLLTDYCRYWHKSMPFMFEREGDYTELLIPTGLLADGAILSRAREVLTEDVCADVEVIGWLYQFYISERKDEVFAGFKKNRKAGADEIPAATQLFTPHWIVRYLVENSLGRLWILNRPTSRLVDQMDYYVVPANKETDFLRITRPEELTIIDPAVGSGHILAYAFDLLYSIYEEDGYAPADIPGLILRHNLHGTEIDPRAGALAAFALAMKARAKQRSFFTKGIQPNVCVIEAVKLDSSEMSYLHALPGGSSLSADFWNQFRDADTLGALISPTRAEVDRAGAILERQGDAELDIFARDVDVRARRVLRQAKALAGEYAAVVANPPYMGSGNMSAALAELVKATFPDEKQDLYACFVSRAYALARQKGLIAMIVGDTWMTIKTFEGFRAKLLARGGIVSFLHLDDVSNHPDIFGANAAFVLERDGGRDLTCSYIHLEPLSSEQKRIQLVSAIRDSDLPWVHQVQSSVFSTIPGAPFVYRMSEAMRGVFARFPRLSELADARQGLATANDARFLRLWWEVSRSRTGLGLADRSAASASGLKWFPFNKGGPFRRWYGNIQHVINWEDDGRELHEFRPRSVIRNPRYYLHPAVTWSNVSSGAPAFRAVDEGVIFGHVGQSIFGSEDSRTALLSTLNSDYGHDVLSHVSPTLHFEAGTIARLPINLQLDPSHRDLVRLLVDIARRDWDTQETSLGFERPDLLSAPHAGRLSEATSSRYEYWVAQTDRVRSLEDQNNALVLRAYGLEGEIDRIGGRSRVSLTNNPHYRFESVDTELAARVLFIRSAAEDLVSYAVGCTFGRYSLDDPGMILADQGATLQDYLAKVPSSTFRPDADNVIPFVDDGWFEDDIVEKFRQFLRAAFGPEHFEENLRFVEESLGVATLRDYFITKTGKSKFYDDHVQRYKKRPIYWMFSSPKGSFNALIYMHRYNPSTVSTVLNEYLREYRAKLEVALANAEQAAAGSTKDQKEADRLRKVLAELRDYEHDVLYPLATQQLAINLDDGVKTNYPKFYPALKKITGLEAGE